MTTTTLVGAVTAQLVEDLGVVAGSLEVFGEPVPDSWRPVAARLAEDLCSTDEGVAAAAAQRVMRARWPGGALPPHGWWHTPAGRMVARSVGGRDETAVTRVVAAAMLGVTPGTVATLVHRGTLARHHGGGIARASVMARLSRMADASVCDPE